MMNKLVEKPDDTSKKDNDTTEDIVAQVADDGGLAKVFKDYFKRAGVLIGVWSWGYMRMSSAWLLMGLFFYCGNEKFRTIKEKKRKFLKTAAKEDEKNAILSSIDELPSWVYFPDVERCEWINKIIKQMWPFIGEYFKNLLETTVLASVESSLPNALKPFKFGNIQLGDVPPRIGGVKVYIDNVKRNEIYMDIEINYASDCNVKMTVKGLNLGIKDIMLHGTMRVIMKPLVNKIPIIGGYTFFFLNQPTLDFDLTGVTNLLDLPMISNSIRSLILEQISNYMVPPNKLAFPVVDGITADQLKHTLPDGVMRLNVIAGKNLKSADVQFLGKGKSDPYCKILVGADKYKTKVIQNTCNPHWDDTFDMIIDQKLGQFAEIMVFDEDPGEDDELGSFSLDIQDVESNGFIDSWFPLENVKTGLIHLKANFFYLSKDSHDIEKISRMSCQLNDLASVLVMVTIDSAASLKRIKKMLEPTPYVKLWIGPKEYETNSVLPTTNPKFEETFQFLVNNINSHDLDIEVKDKNKGKILGTTTISLQEALTSHDMTLNRPFQLQGGDPNSQITVQVVIRILSEEKPKDWARENLFKAVDYVLKESVSDASKANTETKLKNNNNVTEKIPLGQTKHDSMDKPDITISSPASKTIDNNVVNDKTESDMSITNSSNTSPTSTATSPGTSPATSPLDHVEGIRQRLIDTENDSQSESMQSSTSSVYLGKIQLTIRYSQQRSRLIVAIHKCTDLLACDSDGVSDPYVRLYLLPDRSNHSKRKTHTIKDNLNPIFDEKVEWTVTHEEAVNRTLEIGVKNAVSMFSKNRTHIGKVFIDLHSLDLNQASTNWYDLQDGELMKQE